LEFICDLAFEIWDFIRWGKKESNKYLNQDNRKDNV